MIFVETSAIVAILLQEEGWSKLSEAIENAGSSMTGSHVRLEVCMVVASRRKLPAAVVNRQFQDFITGSHISVAPLTDEISQAAVVAFDKYGKGRNSQTALNLADCISYAFAKCHNLKILFTGTDFNGTDLKAA
jgi:ribonuclease VapC